LITGTNIDSEDSISRYVITLKDRIGRGNFFIFQENLILSLFPVATRVKLIAKRTGLPTIVTTIRLMMTNKQNSSSNQRFLPLGSRLIKSLSKSVTSILRNIAFQRASTLHELCERRMWTSLLSRRPRQHPRTVSENVET
jgi:hypothetical protein